MTGLVGIDVSNNNADVSMPAARAQGIGFCIAKCSQGWAGGPGGWMDWTWVQVVTRARAAGMLAGGYHWLLRGNGAAQAQQFVASLQRAGGPKGFICGVDVEENVWDQSLNPDAATLEQFLAEWDALTGGQPIVIYSAPWYWGPYMGSPTQFANRPLWVAQYTGVAPALAEQSVASVTPGFMSPFGGWSSYAVRQFTDNVLVLAENGAWMQVDANVTYLTAAQLVTLTAPPGKPSPSGEFVMDAEAKAAIADLKTTVQQLVTVIQGPVKPGGPNPYDLVGTRDLARALSALAARVAVLEAKP